MGRHHVHYDFLILLLLLFLSSIGLFLLLTIDKQLFYQQGVFLFIGLVLMVVLSRVESVFLWTYAPYEFILANLLLVVSYFGPTIRGATRWIVIAGVQLQPSELVKPFVMLFWAWVIAKYPPRQMRWLPLHLALLVVPLLLVFKQPDLGSSLVYISFWFSMMIAGGLSLRLVVVTFLLCILGVPLWWQHMEPYQQSRITTFLSPGVDPRGAGYNALQATISVGSGQLFGRGLGRGTQSHLRFLPEHHTDFIFATLIEELGFIGGMLLLTCYAGLMWRILRQLWRWTDYVPSFLYGVGLFAMLLSQTFINVGMNMGILPITGITLPFVSYGGSSILSLALAFGIFWAVGPSRETPAAVAIR